MNLLANNTNLKEKNTNILRLDHETSKILRNESLDRFMYTTINEQGNQIDRDFFYL